MTRSVQPSQSAFIQQDTIDPIRHMVSGKIFDSRSAYLKECERTNTKVVGNDWVGGVKHDLPDKLTEERIVDAMDFAESTVGDSSKLRAFHNQNLEILERREKLLYGNR